MNFEQKEVAIQVTKFDVKGNDKTDYTRVLTAYPKHIIIHNNPISNQGTMLGPPRKSNAVTHARHNTSL